MKKFTPFEIVWIDAEASGGQWHDEDDFIKWKEDKSYCRDIGYYLEEDEDFIYGCGSFNANQKTNQIDLTGRLFKVPKKWIKEMKKL